MARLISLIVLLVGAGLADESSNKDFQVELLKMLNETNQKLNLLTKLVHDHAEDAENQFGDVRKTLKCLRASSAKTTLLSNGKMYSFQLVEKSWSSANETCEKQGLHLAKIRDSDDLKLVLEEGNKVSQYTVSWWVSAKNDGSGSEKDFRWHDGTKLDGNSSLWRKGDFENDDCVRVYNNFSYSPFYSHNEVNLFRHPCTDSSKYICEVPSECY